jgi:uncharacterized repeat protein (TIGR03803 family)
MKTSKQSPASWCKERTVRFTARLPKRWTAISWGTVFKMQPDGSGFTVLKCFTNAVEGMWPFAGLTLSGSTLYGTTCSGGTSNYGIVFKVNTDGTGFTVLKHFAGSPDLSRGFDSLHPLR